MLAENYVYQGLSWLDKSEKYDHEYHVHYSDGFNEFLLKKHWGVYDVNCAFVITNNGDTLFSKIALIGFGKDTLSDIALFLRNTNTQLSIADRVNIEGRCFIPLGLTKQNMSTQYVHFSSGQVQISPDTLFSLPNISAIATWLINNNNIGKTKIILDDTEMISFASKPLLINADTVIVKGKLMGNILISAQYIEVSSTAALMNVILIGRNIFFGKNFSGNLQAFASDSIMAGDNDHFNYPSVLALLPQLRDGKAVDNSNSIIQIGDSMRLSGELYAYARGRDVNQRMRLYTGTGSIVYGGIYSSCDLYWNGDCKGTIICDKIYYSNEVTSYENMIQNSRIEVDSLPDFFSYSLLFPMLSNKKVVQWLR
ncbi:MAG: hypothetical protein P4L41_02820 [Flavipsychrobacter sp.]|nr:hypothetical protein [Flavipsychrobacter sp.]